MGICLSRSSISRSVLCNIEYQIRMVVWKSSSTHLGHWSLNKQNQFLFIIIQMSNRRNPSFRLAVEGQGKDQSMQPSGTSYLQCQQRRLTLFQKMVRRIGNHYLTDEFDRQYYADRYTCCPPPLFVPAITLVEVLLNLFSNLIIF